jgi:hypothetical protein
MSSIVKGEEIRTIKMILQCQLHNVKTNSVMRNMNCEIVLIKIQNEHHVATKTKKIKFMRFNLVRKFKLEIYR